MLRQSSDYSQANRDTHIVGELLQVHALRLFETHDTKIPEFAVVELSIISEQTTAHSAEFINQDHSSFVITLGPGWARKPPEHRRPHKRRTVPRANSQCAGFETTGYVLIN